MMQRIDSDLSTAVENSCRGFVVDTGFCDDHAGGVDGTADSSIRAARGACNAARRMVVVGVKRNGFDNFTGDSLGHLLTPNDNYYSRFTRPNQGKSGRPDIFDFEIGVRHSAIANKLRFYRTTGEFMMDKYWVYGVGYFA